MPEPSQTLVIDKFLNTCFQIIQCDLQFDLGTKILYLERASTLDYDVFINWLDKLDKPELTGEARYLNLALIYSLKLLNELYFNEVRYQNGQQDVYTYYFSALFTISPVKAKQTIRTNFECNFYRMNTALEEVVSLEKNARIVAEKSILGQRFWRYRSYDPLKYLSKQAPYNAFFQIPNNEDATDDAFTDSLFANARYSLTTIENTASIYSSLREKLYNRVNRAHHFHHITRGSVTRLKRLIQVFPEFKEHFYKRISSDLQFTLFVAHNIAKLAVFIELFPEHKEEFYSRIKNENVISYFIDEEPKNIKLLLTLFPEHKKELTQLTRHLYISQTLGKELNKTSFSKTRYAFLNTNTPFPDRVDQCVQLIAEYSYEETEVNLSIS